MRKRETKYRATEGGAAARRGQKQRRIASGVNALALARQRDARKLYDLELFSEAPNKRVHATAAKVVVLSDIQMPFEDPAALEQSLRVVDSVQPDLVVLDGDIVDCYAESSFLKDPRKAAESTKQGHRRARALMERLAHVPQKIWMGGNHEQRWQRVVWRQFELNGGPGPVAANLLELVKSRTGYDLDLLDEAGSFERIFDMPAHGFKYYPYSHRLYLAEGNLVVTHGKYVSRHSAYAAKRTFEWLGKSCIVGHTHRQGTYRITMDGREHGAWENGCLCQLEPEYDDAPNWQQGFSVVRIDGPEFHVVQVPIIRRRGEPVAVYGGLTAGAA